VVDDNPTWALLVRKHLGPDHRIIQCLSGGAAEADYAKYRPDWVWLDISMPDVDGFVAARAILARWKKARVVFVTQHDEGGFRDEAIRLGVAGYVLKDNLDEAVELMRRASDPASIAETQSEGSCSTASP